MPKSQSQKQLEKLCAVINHNFSHSETRENLNVTEFTSRTVFFDVTSDAFILKMEQGVKLQCL